MSVAAAADSGPGQSCQVPGALLAMERWMGLQRNEVLESDVR